MHFSLSQPLLVVNLACRDTGLQLVRRDTLVLDAMVSRVVHVIHPSGSGGTSMCLWALQHEARGSWQTYRWKGSREKISTIVIHRDWALIPFMGSSGGARAMRHAKRLTQPTLRLCIFNQRFRSRCQGVPDSNVPYYSATLLKLHYRMTTMTSAAMDYRLTHAEETALLLGRWPQWWVHGT